jgi:homocitrate synthase NifV
MSDFVLKGIIDSTLREGVQTPGVAFSRDQKLKIIQCLVTLGIEEIEIGVASQRSPELCSLVAEAVCIARGTCRISLWSRCLVEDIKFARRCNPDTLSLSMPVSDIHLQEKLNRDRHWVLENLDRSITTALEFGFATVSVGLEDATRADSDFLRQAAETIAKSGASRLRLADTVGIASPGTITKLVKGVQEIVSIPVGIHTHNDFGMATANAVAALDAGAGWVDATVLGLGERAGNCRLEEIVGYLSLNKNIDHYSPKELHKLCNVISQAARIAIPANHPVVGDAIFTCETGLHVQGLLQNPCTYEPFEPERMGRKRTFLFGGKTGRSAVQNRLTSLGYNVTGEDAEKLVVHIRHVAKQKGAPLGEQDLVMLAQQKE